MDIYWEFADTSTNHPYSGSLMNSIKYLKTFVIDMCGKNVLFTIISYRRVLYYYRNHASVCVCAHVHARRL